jgi:hypothetical protein
VVVVRLAAAARRQLEKQICDDFRIGLLRGDRGMRGGPWSAPLLQWEIAVGLPGRSGKKRRRARSRTAGWLCRSGSI